MSIACVWVPVYLRRKHQIPWELELQAIVNHLPWVLRTQQTWGSLEEGQSLLTGEPSQLLKLLVCVVYICVSLYRAVCVRWACLCEVQRLMWLCSLIDHHLIVCDRVWLPRKLELIDLGMLAGQ